MKQQVKLPPFAQDLKLTFNSSQHQSSNYENVSSKQEVAVHILQTIREDKNLLLYDNDCCYMVSRY